MNMVELLDRPVAFHRCFVDLTGDVKAALLLSQALYWQRRAKQKDGWWYHTREEWLHDTGLTRPELETARGKCKPYLLYELRDIPAVTYYHVDEAALERALMLLAGITPTGETESGNQVGAVEPNNNKNTQTNTQTTRAPKWKGNALWNLQHGQEPTPEQLADALDAELLTKIPNRLSEGLRLGQFPQDLDAQKVYRWIAEREAEGQSLDRFVEYIMSDPRRSAAAWVYHKTPQYIKRDWPRAFPQASAQGKAPGSGTFYG